MGLEEYDRRKAEYVAIRKELRELDGQACGWRCSVGVVDSMAGLGSVALVHGQGDTWEEAFAAAQRSK
jgi:hypothetical protein